MSDIFALPTFTAPDLPVGTVLPGPQAGVVICQQTSRSSLNVPADPVTLDDVPYGYAYVRSRTGTPTTAADVATVQRAVTNQQTFLATTQDHRDQARAAYEAARDAVPALKAASDSANDDYDAANLTLFKARLALDTLTRRQDLDAVPAAQAAVLAAQSAVDSAYLEAAHAGDAFVGTQGAVGTTSGLYGYQFELALTAEHDLTSLEYQLELAQNNQEASEAAAGGLYDAQGGSFILPTFAGGNSSVLVARQHWGQYQWYEVSPGHDPKKDGYIVPQLGYTSPLTSTVNAMRGSLPVAIQVASGGIPTALPTGAVLFYGVKLSTALKGDWLTNCQLAASTDPGLPGWWTGTLLLNTPEMRAAMHAELDDPVAELPVLDCLAEIYYTIPGQTDPVFSLNFDFTVGAPLYNGTEGMAPSPNQPYPPASTLNDAVVKANSALQPGSEDTYCFFCQGSSVGSYFYVEGATAYLASAQQSESLVAGFLVVILGARGLTRISCVSLNVLDFGTLPAGLTFLDANPSFLTTAAQDSVLAQLVANGKPNGGLYLSGQGAGPSAAGHANALILQARGWFVAANF